MCISEFRDELIENLDGDFYPCICDICNHSSKTIMPISLGIYGILCQCGKRLPYGCSECIKEKIELGEYNCCSVCQKRCCEDCFKEKCKHGREFICKNCRVEVSCDFCKNLSTCCRKIKIPNTICCKCGNYIDFWKCCDCRFDPETQIPETQIPETQIPETQSHNRDISKKRFGLCFFCQKHNICYNCLTYESKIKKVICNHCDRILLGIKNNIVNCKKLEECVICYSMFDLGVNFYRCKHNPIICLKCAFVMKKELTDLKCPYKCE